MKFPRGNPDQANIEVPLATGGWGHVKGAFHPGDIWIGRTEDGAAIGYNDERHLVTVAGSRAGKGRSCIIPNLCLWPKSCVVIDPKGENAHHTAEPRSRMPGHRVAVLDPFRVSGVPEQLYAAFNPLDLIDEERTDAIDEAALVAEALVVATDERDAHWTESARAFIEALILYVCWRESRDSGRRDLIRVRSLLMRGAADIVLRLKMAAEQKGEPLPDRHIDSFEVLLNEMQHCEAFGGVVAGAAMALSQIGDRERGSILSTARRNTKFLDSPAMADTLRHSDFDPDTLKTTPDGVSLYLCLPARHLASHARWLRLVINLTLSRMEALGKRDDERTVLFILDEFAVLGHMESLEKAAGFMAGHGVKLWTILQDLTQLQRHYQGSWETFLGNAGLLQFFGNTDLTTLFHISKRLGEVEVIRRLGTESSNVQSTQSDMPELQQISVRKREGVLGAVARSDTKSETSSTNISKTENIQRSPLLTAEEVGRFFSRRGGWQLVFLDGFRPLALKRTNFDEDPAFQDLYTP